MSTGSLLCNVVPFAFKSGVFYPVSRLEREGGWLLECKHPTKEGMDSELCHFPPLMERLVVYTPLHTGEGADFFPQLLSSSWSFIALSLWTKPPGEFFKLLITLLKKPDIRIYL